MKHLWSMSKSALLLSIVCCAAASSPAQEGTEITGFYQQYRDFSFKLGQVLPGIPGPEIPAAKMNGGGFNVAQNLAPWFSVWTQLSFFGRVEGDAFGARVINNLQGIRYMTRRYGPLRLYGKGGAGFSHISIDVSGSNIGGEYKFSLGYGGGAHIWLADFLAVNLDVSHVTMGLPNLTDAEGRDKWDSGLTYTTGLTIKF